MSALARKHDSITSEQLVAFVDDGPTANAVRAGVAARWPTVQIQEGGLQNALAVLTHEAAPPLMIVDVTGSDDPVGAMRAILNLCESWTRVVAIGPINDVALYRELIGIGISDYLVKPFVPSAIEDALDRATRPVAETATNAQKLRIVGVIGARDGVGATTVAVNVGWLMANELGRTTGIVDLDLQYGTVALALDLEPSHGVREALEKPDRIDELLIASAMAHESEHLYVLSAEEPIDDEIEINPNAFEPLIEALPDDFDCLIFDVPARMAARQKRLLSRMDAIAVVSDLSIAGMRDTTRLIQFLRVNAPDAAVTVIANKVGPRGSGDLPKAEFQKGADVPVKHFLPLEAKLVGEAANAGKPLAMVAKRSVLVKSLKTLAQILAADRSHLEVKRSGGLFGKRAPKP